MEHEGSTNVWLSEAREFFARTAGGQLELRDVFDMLGGGALHPSAHRICEFNHIASSYDLLTTEHGTEQIGAGDQLVIAVTALQGLTTANPPAHRLFALCWRSGWQRFL